MAARLQSRAGPWQPDVKLDSTINIVRCCSAPLARNLVLLCMFLANAATDLAVHVYETVSDGTRVSFSPVTSFLIGSRVTAAAWSPGTSYEADEASKECKITYVRWLKQHHHCYRDPAAAPFAVLWA